MGLFSTTHHHTKTVNVPYEKSVTINEYKAPTDKSVELLNEFEKKAHENIIYKSLAKGQAFVFPKFSP